MTVHEAADRLRDMVADCRFWMANQPDGHDDTECKLDIEAMQTAIRWIEQPLRQCCYREALYQLSVRTGKPEGEIEMKHGQILADFYNDILSVVDSTDYGIDIEPEWLNSNAEFFAKKITGKED